MTQGIVLPIHYFGVVLSADWLLALCQYPAVEGRYFAQLRDWTDVVMIAATFLSQSRAVAQIAGETQSILQGIAAVGSLAAIDCFPFVVASDVDYLTPLN